MAQMLLNLIMKFATEGFLADLIILAITEVSKLTSNTVDDQLVEMVKKAPSGL